MPSPISLVTDREDYYYVSLGPIPGKPAWHEQSKPSRYPFPSIEAATRFARSHKERDPDRDITIDYPDGRRWDGKRFVS